MRDEVKKYDICRPCGIRKQKQKKSSNSATSRIEIIWINKMQLCELRFLMSKSIWINYGLSLSNFSALIVCSEFYFVVRFRAGDVCKKSELYWWKWEPSRRITMSGEIIKLNWKFRIQNSTFVQSKTVQQRSWLIFKRFYSHFQRIHASDESFKFQNTKTNSNNFSTRNRHG